MKAGEQEATREKLLDAAHAHFAQRGFYGASIAQIAGDLGLTKQALLYHFKRKEDLYGAVLARISDRLIEAVREAKREDLHAEQQLEDLLLALYERSQANPADTRILMRELLDNQARAETARDWYLKPFLDELLAVLRDLKGFEQIGFAQGFAIIYQLLGAIEYFAISAPTLSRMYGEAAYENARAAFPGELRSQIRQLIASRP